MTGRGVRDGSEGARGWGRREAGRGWCGGGGGGGGGAGDAVLPGFVFGGYSGGMPFYVCQRHMLARSPDVRSPPSI